MSSSEIYGCLSPILAFVALIFLGFIVGLMAAASQADDVLYGDDHYDDK